MATLQHPEQTPYQLRRDGAWGNVISKIDAAIDQTHLKVIMHEIASDVERWPEDWKMELREYCRSAMASLGGTP